MQGAYHLGYSIGLPTQSLAHSSSTLTAPPPDEPLRLITCAFGNVWGKFLRCDRRAAALPPIDHKPKVRPTHPRALCSGPASSQDHRILRTRPKRRVALGEWILAACDGGATTFVDTLQDCSAKFKDTEAPVSLYLLRHAAEKEPECASFARRQGHLRQARPKWNQGQGALV